MNAALRLAALTESKTPAEWFDLLTEKEQRALLDDFVCWAPGIEPQFHAWIENRKEYKRETGGAEE